MFKWIVYLIMLLAPSIVLSSEKYQKSRQLSEAMTMLYIMVDMCENLTAYHTDAIKDNIERYYIEQTGVFINPIDNDLAEVVAQRKIDPVWRENAAPVCDEQIRKILVVYDDLRKDWQSLGILKPPLLDLKSPLA